MRTQVLRPVRNLSRRFSFPIAGKRLDSYELFTLLRQNGLIVGVAYGPDGQPTHYRETREMLSLPEEQIKSVLREGLTFGNVE